MNRKDSIKQQEQRGTRNRNKIISALAHAGVSQVELGRSYGLTKQRVNAIIKREKQLERSLFGRFIKFIRG